MIDIKPLKKEIPVIISGIEKDRGDRITKEEEIEIQKINKIIRWEEVYIEYDEDDEMIGSIFAILSKFFLSLGCLNLFRFFRFAAVSFQGGILLMIITLLLIFVFSFAVVYCGWAIFLHENIFYTLCYIAFWILPLKNPLLAFYRSL